MPLQFDCLNIHAASHNCGAYHDTFPSVAVVAFFPPPKWMCHLLLDATLELTTRFLLASCVCRLRPARWKRPWRRLSCRKWRGSSSLGLGLGAPLPPLVLQALRRHRTCKTCFDTRSSIPNKKKHEPQGSFLDSFKNRMCKMSIHVPGSIN